MQAAPTYIIQYFDGTKQNLIPLFQRPYSWREDDWRTLWEDLLSCHEAASGPHFMGAIVTAPASSIPVGVGKALVIDGQQRLTTVSILLATLRDAIGDDRKSALIQDYLTNRHYEGADELKLLPTQTDRASYSAMVIDRRTDEPFGIHAAYRYFRDRIEREGASPAALLETLQTRIQVVYIHLGESDDPYLIFESLNAKGKDLDPTDLVRNYVLMRFRHDAGTGGEQEEIYGEVWRPLERELGSSLRDFLFHYAQKDGDESVRKSFYSAFKESIRRHEADGVLRAELNELRDAGLNYRTLLGREEHTPSSRVAAHVRTIQSMNAQTPFPLLIRLLRLHGKGVMPLGDLEQAFGDVASTLIRRAICGVPTNVLNKLFARLCRNLSDEDTAAWLADELAKADFRERCPKDVELAEALRTQNQYGRPFLSHLLRRVERSYGHLELVDLDGLTIEHVLPQTLTQAWREELGPEAETIHAQKVHLLGNLTLTGYNGALSNEPFATKRELLRESNLSMNKDIAKRDRWRASEIDERGEKMAMRVASIWPVPKRREV